MPILDVPYVYKVIGQRPRERNTYTRHLVGMTPVKIAEYTDGQAPVVARCRYAGQGLVEHDGRIGPRNTEVEVDYRLVNGRLMRRAVLDRNAMVSPEYNFNLEAASGYADPRTGAALRAATQCAEGAATVTAELAQATMHLLGRAMTKGVPELVLRKPGRKRLHRQGVMAEADLDFNRVERSDQAGRAAEIARAMEQGAAVVEGVLYLPSWGPCWVLNDRHIGGERLDVEALPEIAWVTDDGEWAFQGHQQDALEMAVAATARRQNRRASPVEYHGAVEVLDPAALPLDPDDYAIRAAADNLLTRMGESILKTGDPDGVIGFAEVMRGMKDPDGDAAAMLPGMRAICAAWEAHVPEGDPRRWFSDMLHGVLDRDEARRALAQPGLDRAGLAALPQR